MYVDNFSLTIILPLSLPLPLSTYYYAHNPLSIASIQQTWLTLQHIGNIVHTFVFLTNACHQNLQYGIINFIPVFPLQAKKAVRGGDIVSAKKSAQKALYCNIGSIVCAVIAYFSLLFAVVIGSTHIWGWAWASPTH